MGNSLHCRDAENDRVDDYGFGGAPKMMWVLRREKKEQEEQVRIELSNELERRIKEVNRLVEELRQRKGGEDGTGNSTS